MELSKVNISEVKSKIILKEHYWENIYSTNCYAFALGLDIPEREMPFSYNLGFIYCYINDIEDDEIRRKSYENKLLMDLDALELEHEEADPEGPTTIDINYDENGNAIVKYSWLIALFKSKQRGDFHFLRKTPNGIWWHKQGWDSSPGCGDWDGSKVVRDPTKKQLFYYDEYVKTYRLKLTKKN